MTLTAINDWHLGAIRSGGTTPATAYQLRLDLLTSAENILYGISSDLLINGDLFDGPDIPKADLLRAVQIFGDWLTRTGKHLYAADGNHDLSKNSQIGSAYQLFVALLIEMHGPERVTHIEKQGEHIKAHRAYVIPHVANQDLFNHELECVPENSEIDYLFVHCNYDNGFAIASDHSLNMSAEQAAALPVKHIIFGHEHQQKTALDGKVIIVGNQFPSSVSDCLGNDSKRLIRLEDVGMILPETWAAEGDFSEQDWRSLEDTGRFIRVTGQATAAEADKVVTTIARFRKESNALVITNAVKIEGVDDASVLALSHEEVTSFNVREALMEHLGPDDATYLQEIEKKHAQ